MNSKQSALLERYRYLCKRGAKKFGRRGEDRADLEQVAAIGLLKAIENYREDRQTPFEAFAWMTIQGELMHHVRDHERLVRPPRRLRDLERQWRNARSKLFKKLGREASDEEIVRHLALNPQAASELREYRDRATVASLDELPPKFSMLVSYTIESHDDRMMLESAFELLSELERRIILAIYVENYSVAETAQRVGYSSRHVGRLRNTALRKITEFFAATNPNESRPVKKQPPEK